MIRVHDELGVRWTKKLKSIFMNERNHMNSKFVLAVIAAFVLFSTKGFAQHGEEHAHKSVHGGDVVSASGGDYHVEMLKKEGKVIFYLLDDDEKTLSIESVTGSALFQFDDKTVANEKLTVEGKEMLIVTTTKADKPFTCVVSLKYKDKSLTAKFTKEAMHSETEEGHVYYCPMHPDVTSDKPGKCPKCGMTLKLKEHDEKHHHD